LFSGGFVRAADTAQLVGTVREHRGRWNPFASDNTMSPVEGGGFTATVPLSTTGGRNGDGIYAMRFYTNQDLRQVFKRGKQAGELVTGPGAAFAHNILFRVPTDGIYSVRFDPKSATYAISPPVEELPTITSLQINGFVHDAEGGTECFDGRRTRPAEKWDEGVPAHELSRTADGAWVIELPLSSKGGHEKNGIYQCLLSANNNADHGFGAILGKAGRLAGGNGYESRVGHIEETAIVFRVDTDGLYTLKVWPEEFRFAISPEVTFFQSLRFQIDGDTVPDPWNPAAPSHDMTKGPGGLWQMDLELSKDGGTAHNGIYTMNFSIDGDWALDSIGYGGAWGKTWHSAPQEWNLLFRVPANGTYRVTLDPDKGTFSFKPPVEPIEEISSLQICGDFEDFSADGKSGWNPLDPMHDMQTQDRRVFTKTLRLKEGNSYKYKYAANRAGWHWSLVDYPYDGRRSLATHGNPPPLVFECPRDGNYLFTADVVSGNYSVVLTKHR
jgi:hypothetical protein